MTDTIGTQHAELLGRVELFAGLDRMALSQLAAHVTAVSLEPGTPLFVQGDESDCLYVLADGALATSVAGVAPGSETVLNVLAPGDSIGEMGLMTGQPRSATVHALGPAEVLRLERDRFLDLVQTQPSVAAAVATILSHRLRAADQARLQADLALGQSANDVLAALGPEEQDRIVRAGALAILSPEGIAAVFEADAQSVTRGLERLGLRNALLTAAASRVLEERFAEQHDREEAARISEEAHDRLTGAGCWAEALDLAARRLDRAALSETLGRALRAVPPIDAAQALRWTERLSPDEIAADPEVALLAATSEDGSATATLPLLQRALGAALLSGDTAAAERLTEAIAAAAPSAVPAGSHPRWRPFAARAAPRGQRVRTLLVAAAIALAVSAAVAGPGRPQWVFGLLLGGALALWNSHLFPDFAVGLLLIAAWTLWGIADAAQAMAGFATMDWIFVVAVMGIAAAIARSGLLFRVGLLLVRRTPGGLLAQATTLLVTGILLSPLLPDPRGRAALSGPLALAVAQASRFKNRDPAAAVLGLAAWIGSGPLMFMFLNAAPVCLLAWGLMPEDRRARFDWLSWLVAALPLGALMAVGALVLLFALLRPDSSGAPSRDRLALQLAVLGPLTRREGAMLLVLTATVLAWFAAPALHVHVGVIAIFGLFAAVATGSFDQRSLREMDWGYLLYYGTALSIAHVAAQVGVGGGAGSHPGEMHFLDGSLMTAGGPLVFVLALALASMIIRIVLESSQTVLLLSLLFVPLGAAIDVNPWIVVVTLLATNSLWITEKQTPAYAVAYTATEGRLYSHAQARKVAFGYAAMTLAALALCIPYWRWLGLL